MSCLHQNTTDMFMFVIFFACTVVLSLSLPPSLSRPLIFLGCCIAQPLGFPTRFLLQEEGFMSEVEKPRFVMSQDKFLSSTAALRGVYFCKCVNLSVQHHAMFYAALMSFFLISNIRVIRALLRKMLRGSCSGQRSSACLLTPRPSSRQNGFLQPLRFIWPSLTGLTLIKVEKQQRQHIILVDQGLCEGKCHVSRLLIHPISRITLVSGYVYFLLQCLRFVFVQCASLSSVPVTFEYRRSSSPCLRGKVRSDLGRFATSTAGNQWIGQRGKKRARGAAGVKTRWAAFQRSNGRVVMYWKLKPFQIDILMGYWKLKTCLGGTYFHGSGKGKCIDGNTMQLWAWSGLGSSAGGAAGDFASCYPRQKAWKHQGGLRLRSGDGRRKWDTTQSHGSGL